MSVSHVAEDLRHAAASEESVFWWVRVSSALDQARACVESQADLARTPIAHHLRQVRLDVARHAGDSTALASLRAVVRRAADRLDMAASGTC